MPGGRSFPGGDLPYVRSFRRLSCRDRLEDLKVTIERSVEERLLFLISREDRTQQCLKILRSALATRLVEQLLQAKMVINSDSKSLPA